MYTTNEVNLKFNYILNQVELMYTSQHESSVYYTSFFCTQVLCKSTCTIVRKYYPTWWK